MLNEITLILLFGILLGKIIGIIKLPDVCGYLIAGMIIGPSISNLINENSVDILQPIITIALTFISFQIGSEFKISSVKRLGHKPFIISLFTSLITTALVTSGALFLGYSLSFSLMLGVISSSSAPAAILTIIKSYKAKGKLTNNVLGIVAIDDIISIVMFGLALAFVEFSKNGSEISVLEPFIEIAFSVLIGSLLGLVLGKIAKFLKDKSEIFALVVAFIFLVLVLSNYLPMSYMLSATVMGFVFINSFKYQVVDRILNVIDLITPVLTIIFFVLAGASLNLTFLPTVWLIVLVCIVLRVAGKIFGSLISEKITNFDKKVSRYLGFCLLPQTGIAVGLAAAVAPLLGNEGYILVNVIIATSLVFDIIGSILFRISLKKMKEIE